MFEDWTKYTMEQLVEKQDQLYHRLNQSAASGSTGLIDSLMRLIDTIETEMRNRTALESARATIENSPKIIETDPELAREHKQIAAAEEEEVREERPRRHATSKRSSKPTSISGN